MEKRHVQAQSHLREARKHAVWAENDRVARAPKLTDRERAQLQQYLGLLRGNNPEVFPRGDDGSNEKIAERQ